MGCVAAATAFTVNVKALVVVPAALSVTRTVKVDIPAAVGVPVNASVPGFSVNPGGNAPAITAHAV